MKVYKYTLETEKENVIHIPELSTVLHVHEQDNKACMWVRVFQEEKVQPRKFICMVTGIDFDGGDYIGTCHLDSGKFVVHVFEIL